MSKATETYAWESQIKDHKGPVFIVLTTSDKDGTVSPPVIGPFDSLVEAMRFGVEQCDEIVGDWPPGSGNDHPLGIRVPLEGGYAGVIYVSAVLADTPDDYLDGEWGD